jgi:hypothetical protein
MSDNEYLFSFPTTVYYEERPTSRMHDAAVGRGTCYCHLRHLRHRSCYRPIRPIIVQVHREACMHPVQGISADKAALAENEWLCALRRHGCTGGASSSRASMESARSWPRRTVQLENHHYPSTAERAALLHLLRQRNSTHPCRTTSPFTISCIGQSLGTHMPELVD